MLLSILICTVYSRYKLFSRLHQQLSKQMVPGVEYVVKCDNGEESIGKKRNLLKELAKGEYVVYIDDDDHISKNYIKNILKAIQTKPDAVGIRGLYTHNFNYKCKLISSAQCEQWGLVSNTVTRQISHINPVKKCLAMQVTFPEVYYGEDRFYTEALKKLVKTEVMADGCLYWYDFRPHLSESIKGDIKDNHKGQVLLENLIRENNKFNLK